MLLNNVIVNNRGAPYYMSVMVKSWPALREQCRPD